MKLYHFPALVLAVWYLMLPPLTTDGVNMSAPISQWTKFKDYDHLTGCLSGKAELADQAQQQSVQPPLEFTSRQLRQFASATCVWSDDPALAQH